MKCSSERASPGGSSALSRHCSSRCVFVKWPSFSTCPARGHQEDLGGDVLRSAARPSGSPASPPEAAPSRCRRGRARRATSCSASARRCSPACIEPTAGFWPMTNMPSSAAVERAQHRREVRVVARDLRQVPEAVVVLRRSPRRRTRPSAGRRCSCRSATTSRVLRPLVLDVVLERQVALAGPRRRQVARAGSRRASGCRSSPGSRRGRASP